MALPPAKKPAVEVEIDLGAPKKAGPGAGPEGSDDVQGEMIAKRALRAFQAGDAAALNVALKAHYDHCKASADEPLEEESDLDVSGLFGAGGKPGEGY